MNHSTPGLPVHHQLPELLKLVSIESVIPSKHLILCHPLLLLPTIFSSIRVFSNELALCIRWPKYWSFSISPSSVSNSTSWLLSSGTQRSEHMLKLQSHSKNTVLSHPDFKPRFSIFIIIYRWIRDNLKFRKNFSHSCDKTGSQPKLEKNQNITIPFY